LGAKVTTLGYGDITPLTRIARVLAAGEAVTRQLYLAVLIARLIGMEIISSQQKPAKDSDSTRLRLPKATQRGDLGLGWIFTTQITNQQTKIRSAATFGRAYSG